MPLLSNESRFVALRVSDKDFIGQEANHRSVHEPYDANRCAASPAQRLGAAQRQALRRWHSAEESEHRAVALELYQACGGNYRNRMITAVIAMATFYIDSTRQMVSNLWRDKTLFKPSTAWSLLNYFWHPKRGLAWAVIQPFASYVRKDFHPWKRQSHAQAAQWFASNSGVWRALKPAASITPAQ